MVCFFVHERAFLRKKRVEGDKNAKKSAKLFGQTKKSLTFAAALGNQASQSGVE
jgi:hypothetical protein